MVQDYIIQSDLGDEYKLRITSENRWMLSEYLCNQLSKDCLEVVDIELERSKGLNVTNHKILARIEECIADFFQSHNNVLFCFFCDFISLVPSKKKDMPVQEYRSKLFSAMFHRYVSQHHISNLYNNVVKIKGVAETFYVHIIYRQEHSKYAKMIAEENLKEFNKPE